VIFIFLVVAQPYHVHCYNSSNHAVAGKHVKNLFKILDT
jgi:hypothetical protein